MLQRFNIIFFTPEAQVNTATTSSHDPNWYIDTGATYHITRELEKLTIRGRYNGNEQVHTASGQGMAIHHVGHASFHTPDRPIHLNHVLHVPQATKSLFMHPNMFLIITPLLKFIQFFLLSRIKLRGELFFTARVKKVYILSMAPHHLLMTNKSLVQALLPPLGGTRVLVILRLQ
jgi:hypothetical protein